MDMKVASGDFKVCLCKSKTKDETMAFIKANDIHDLKTLRETFDIGNKCGACAEDLETLISMVWDK